MASPLSLVCLTRPLRNESGLSPREIGLQGFPDLSADPVAQLLGSGHGVGYNEDVVNRQPFFQKQAQKKAGDGIGLAGPRAGLDEIGPFEGAFQEDRSHEVFLPGYPFLIFSSQLIRGSNIFFDSSSNSSFRGSPCSKHT